MAYAVVYNGRRFVISKRETVIGRSPNCGIIAAHNVVSRHHCRLVEDRGVVHLTDLGSRNGTFLNGTRLKTSTATLKAGDRIRLGLAVELVVLETNSQEPVPNLVQDSGDENSTITSASARNVYATIPRVGSALATNEQEVTNTGFRR